MVDNPEMALLLVRIETKLDVALTQQQDHEGRIRSLERWRYALPTTALLSLASVATSIYVAMMR